MPVFKRPIYYKGSKLMDRGKDIGLRSKSYTEVVDEEEMKN